MNLDDDTAQPSRHPLLTARDHEVDTPERHAAAQRSTWVSVIVNVLLTAVQIVVGLASTSQALVADGIHSLSDLLSDFIVLLAAHHSRKEADDDHPHGHQRFENAASLALGGLLLAVGAGMLWSAANKLQAPAAVGTVHTVALWVALGTLLSKELLFRYLLRVGERLRSSMLIANAWHARSDAASSLVVALGIGGNLLGYTLLDPVSALIVGLMVGKMGWGFASNALNDLMDRAASLDDIAHIRTALLGEPGVLGLHDLRTRKMGDLIAVDVHLELDGALSVAEGHDIAVRAGQRVQAQVPSVLRVMTHVDPVRRAV